MNAEPAAPANPADRTAETPISLAVLLVCRNRRETTLAALRALTAERSRFHLTIVLFDDASTDGTSEAVAAAFPETILVAGDGNAFWNGGLHRVWSRALPLPVEGFLWLNDDVVLDADALSRLHAAWTALEAETRSRRFVVVGATRGSDGAITYSGFDRVRTPLALRFVRVPPGPGLTPVDTFNGNIVLVPRAVVEAIGINDPAFHHNLGDLDYGLRATAAGIPVRLAPGSFGICEANKAKSERGYGSPKLGLRDQWRRVNTHHGLPFASWWHMTRRHSGVWQPFHFLLPYWKLVLSPRLVAKLRGR